MAEVYLAGLALLLMVGIGLAIEAEQRRLDQIRKGQR